MGEWFTPGSNARSGAPSSRGRAIGSMAEPLEARIAPATFINAHMVTYTDVDGDLVTIHSSLPIFAKPNINNNTLLTFGTASADGTNMPQQLEKIDLGTLGSKVVTGDDLSITAVKAGSGNGMVNVGAIDSIYTIGHVYVQGDLGVISAGALTGGNHYVGLEGLTVHTLGAQGTATQAPGGSISSLINGAVGSITVQSDMVGAIKIQSNTAGTAVNGYLNSLTIGGNLVGGSASLSGSVTTDGNIKTVKITGSLEGGAGNDSGALVVGEKIGTIATGSLIGYQVASDPAGTGTGSGSISTGNNFPNSGGIGSITLNGDLKGGVGDSSGEISEASLSGGYFGSVKITGAIMGGAGKDSGEVNANALGTVSIGNGITGSSGVDSGSVMSNNGITSLTILKGGIVGGANTGAGSVDAATSPTSAAVIHSIVIHGDITGPTGDATTLGTMTGTGQINTASAIDSVTLYGSLIGGTAPGSGSIVAAQSIGHVTLRPEGTSTGSILGGDGKNSGEISAGSLGTVSIAGKIIGDTVTNGTNNGEDSGEIITSGPITSVTIGTGLFGGIGTSSGVVTTGSGFGNKLGTLNITTGGITGGAGDNSGQVNIAGQIGTVKLNGGAVTGAGGKASGAIIAADNIGTLSIGSLMSGAGASSGEITGGNNLASLTITGGGSSTTVDTGLVAIGGAAGTISVHGDVVGSTASTGLFEIGGAVKNFSMTGKLEGGAGADSGSVFAGTDETSVIGSITIPGGIIGGAGNGSGEIFGGGGISKATVGDVIGGGGTYSGSIISDGALGTIDVTGAGPGVTANSVTTHGVIGYSGTGPGTGNGSGQISAGTTIKSVTINGSLNGGVGAGSGDITSHSAFTSAGDVQGDIGTITITGNVTGGAAINTGEISSAGNITTLNITGSVLGSATPNTPGTAYDGTGAILAGLDITGPSGGNITTLKIGGALQGPDVFGGNGAINGTGYIQAGHIGTMTVGSIIAGSEGVSTTLTNDGSIRVANDIGSLTVTGSIAGTYENPVVISAVGQITHGKTDLAFGKISVGKDGSGNSVTYADFLAGYDQSGSIGTPVNRAASIGSVLVAGNWAGGNLVAGVETTGATFGANLKLIPPTASIIPTIASIIIQGKVENGPIHGAETDGPNMYGFDTGKFGTVSIDGVAQSFPFGSITGLGNSTDTNLEEVTT